MKYRITTLETAYDDLKEIKAYLAKYDSSTVKRFVHDYKKKKATIREFPFSSPAYEGDTDYRKLIVGDYLVFYTVNEDTGTIEIHRILHGSRDARRHLE